MKKLFISVCCMATVFDAMATLLGFCVAAHIKTLPGYLFAGIGALVIVSVLGCTREVWQRKEKVYHAIKPFWGMALVTNVVAAFLACGNHIILEKPLSDSVSFSWSDLRAAGSLPLLSIAVLTLFLTGAPLAVSYLWHTYHEEDEEHSPERPPRKSAAPPPIPRAG